MFLKRTPVLQSRPEFPVDQLRGILRMPGITDPVLFYNRDHRSQRVGFPGSVVIGWLGLANLSPPKFV